MEKEIRAIKIWIAVGSIGFLLIGASAMVLSFAFLKAMEFTEEFQNEDMCEDADENPFRNKATEAFDKGDFENVLKLVGERETTHPYDAEPKWFRAKVFVQQGKFEEARRELDNVVILSPSWEKDYVDPLKRAIQGK